MVRTLELGRDITGRAQRLTPDQRATHMHVLGASKRGKSRFLESLIRQDIRHGHGVCVIDPHGTLYESLVKWCTRYGLGGRRKLHLIDPNELGWVVGLNPLRCDDPSYLATVVDGLVDACAQVWGGEDPNKTPRLKKCLRVVFYALAEKGLTLADAIRLTTVADYDGFRGRVTDELEDPVFRAIWDDLRQLRPREFAETFESTNNRLIEFLGSPTLRQMFSVREGALDLQQCMDEGHVVLVNLQPKRISRANGRVIGTMITNALFSYAVQRDKHTSKRHPFYLYIDECYRFLTDDIEAMLDETRKYGLHVCLAHQRLQQLERYGRHIRNAVLTNAQTKVVFGGLADEDAEPLAREVLRETFDYNRPKTLLDKPVVVGYETVWMKSRGRSVGESIGSGSSTMTGEVAGMSTGEMVGQTYDTQGNPIGMQRMGVSTGDTAATSHGSGRFESSSLSVAHSEGEAQALMPILEMMHTAVEGDTEVMHRAILQIRKLPPRTYFLVRPDAAPTIVRTPDVDEARVLPSQVPWFVEKVREASPFILPVAEVGTVEEEFDPIDDDDEEMFRYRPGG